MTTWKERLDATIAATAPVKAECVDCHQDYEISPKEIVTARIYDNLAKAELAPRVCPVCREERYQAAMRAEEAAGIESGQRMLSEWIARLPARYRAATFEAWHHRPMPDGTEPWYTRSRDFAASFPFAGVALPYTSLLLCGDNGLGKSHLINAIAIEVMRRGLEAGLTHSPVRYIQGYKLVEEVMQTYAPNWDGPSRKDILEQYRGARLLILDDVGDPSKEPSTDHTRAIYFNLIDQRYNEKLPLLMASNSQGDELKAFFGKSTTDRLAEMMPSPIVIRGKSWREITAEKARKA